MRCNVNYRYRSAFGKFGYGVALMRIGRYERKNIEERICFLCNDPCIENEKHVIMFCPLYSDLRSALFNEVGKIGRASCRERV